MKLRKNCVKCILYPAFGFNINFNVNIFIILGSEILYWIIIHLNIANIGAHITFHGVFVAWNYANSNKLRELVYGGYTFDMLIIIIDTHIMAFWQNRQSEFQFILDTAF